MSFSATHNNALKSSEEGVNQSSTRTEQKPDIQLYLSGQSPSHELKALILLSAHTLQLPPVACLSRKTGIVQTYFGEAQGRAPFLARLDHPQNRPVLSQC